MVDLALSCMSLAVYGRTQSNAVAVSNASSRYYRLIQVVQDRIGQVEKASVSGSVREWEIDACLVTVYFLGRYDGAVHSNADNDSQKPFEYFSGWSHRDGSTAILKVWYDHLSHNAPGVIVKETRRGLIRSTFLRNIPVADWMLDGSRFGEQGLELEYDQIFCRILNLHYRYTKSNTKKNQILPEAIDLSSEAQELDKALENWSRLIPETCSYKRHVLEQPGAYPQRNFYSPEAFTFASAGHTALWNQYFTARILINSTYLRILGIGLHSMCSEYYRHQVEGATAHLKTMGECLAATIPFGLGRLTIDASDSGSAKSVTLAPKDQEIKPSQADLLVWPLSVASCLEGIDSKQQKWFQAELASIGRIVGDGILASAESQFWARI